MQETPALETIGARLAWVRYLAREGDAPNAPALPAATLSKLAGLGDNTVNGIERKGGDEGVSSQTIDKIAAVLATGRRVPLMAAWLAFGVGDAPERNDVRRSVQRAQRAGVGA